MHANTWIVHAHWRWGSNSVILTIPSLKVSCHFFFKGFGSPAGSQYLIWEVSTVGTSELQYFDLLQTDLAVSAPCNVSRPREPNPSNASESAASAASDGPEASEGSEDFTEVPRSETTEWPGCIEAGISRQAVDTKLHDFTCLKVLFQDASSTCIHTSPEVKSGKVGESWLTAGASLAGHWKAEVYLWIWELWELSAAASKTIARIQITLKQ